ncbi:protein of unknown function [Methylorubrum extorquens]|uniref:Uncharacterized protein n=1 Tax=Methylorubrum extorquens TaxID=408 RepID=A0A2N9AK17_METEX|nr:protein of unknown function [Methylorubrum extorquens]
MLQVGRKSIGFKKAPRNVRQVGLAIYASLYFASHNCFTKYGKCKA